MGWRSCSDAIALQHWKSLPAPCSPLTFLVMYLGPGFGSMPSSVRSRIHVVQRLVRFESVVVSSLVLLGLGVFGLRVRRLLSTCLITRRCLRVRGLGLGLCVFVLLHVCIFFGIEISSRGLSLLADN